MGTSNRNDDRDEDIDLDETGGARPPWFVERSAFLRQLFFERHFRKALVLGLLILVGTPLFVKPWWVASPPGIEPPIRVSGLDKIQAWSLRRTGRRYAAAGQLADSVTAWRLAIANDSCDPRNTRGLLAMFRDYPAIPWSYQAVAVAQAFWLLRITGTNDADLVLVGETCARLEQDEFVSAFFLPHTEKLDLAKARILLPALFRRGEMDSFSALVQRYPEHLKDPQLELYQAAWQLAWGPRGQSSDGRRLLAAAAADPKRSVLATKLMLAVAFQLGQDDDVKRHLETLQAARADRVSDHVKYWMMLLERGNREAATEMIRTFNQTPVVPGESLALVSVFNRLGLTDEALRLLERHRAIFPTAVDLWIQAATLLISKARWDDLRVLSLDLRRARMVHDQTAGYSAYLEGLAYHELGNLDLANRAFDRIPDLPIANPSVGYITATGLARVGKVEPARALLARFEKSFANRFDYWQQVQFTAYQAGDIEAMLHAAERAYKLAPDNLIVINNYAAALLMLRKRPSEAIQLTLRRVQANSSDPGAQLNHVLALLQNQRLDEAERLLKTLPERGLTPVMTTVLNLAWFETHLLRGRRAEAAKAHQGIKPELLAPPQRKWVEEARARLGTSPG